MGLNRNINDDSTLAYLFNKTRQGASDALGKAVEKINDALTAINNTIASIQTALNNKVSKSGDTMTGALEFDAAAHLFMHSAYSSDNPPASGNVYKFIRFYDKDDAEMGYLRHQITSDGRYGLQLSTIKGSVRNGVNLYIESGGNRSVAFDDPAAWRDGLGAVNKAGDTMTGVLNMSNTNIKVINTSYNSSDTPSSSSFKYIYFDDKSGHHIGYLGSNISSSGQSGFILTGGRQVNGSQVENLLGIYVNSSGDRVVDIPSVAKPAWRKALELGTSGALPITIDQGGTGSTTWEGAADHLQAMKRHPINSGNAVTTSVKRKISFSGTATGQLVVVGNSASRCGMYIFYGSTSGVVVEPIKAASACTITTGTGFFTITSSSGSLYPYIMTGSPFNRFSESAAT